MPVKKIVEKIDFDAQTGLPFIEDTRGNVFPIGWEYTANILESPRIYLQSDMKGFTWGTSMDWNRIPDSLHPGNFLVYTVPDGYRLHFAFVLAAAAQRDGTPRINTLGLFLNGQLRAIAPFDRQLHYILYSPLPIEQGNVLEIKLKPSQKNTDFAINCGGYLIKCL